MKHHKDASRETTPNKKNVPDWCNDECIKGTVYRVSQNIVKYPATPTIPRATSTATSEQ